MREKYIEINNLKVSETLLNFVNDELLKETEISSKDFWTKLDKVVQTFELLYCTTCFYIIIVK